MGTKIQITADCADITVAMAFWGPALGYEPEPPPPGHESWEAFATAEGIPRSQWRGALVDPAGTGPRLFFQTVPEPKSVKNRVHLDIGVTPGPSQPVEERRGPIAAKVAELIGLGATEVETIEEGGGMFTVMRDPEGNEFCVH
jgi:Glyoxalase-like domain